MPGEPFHRNPVVPENIRLRAGDGVLVRNAGDVEGNGNPGLHQDSRAGLAEAGARFNAAAFALEVAWLRLFADAGCLSEDQEAEAVAALAEYTTALQTGLQTTGYYDGEIDGLYGPATVAAVEALQTDADLPVTGYVDRATAAALESSSACRWPYRKLKA